MNQLADTYEVVHSPNGGIMVARPDGKMITKDEALALYRAVNNTLRVHTARRLAAAEREIMASANWVFPETLKDLRSIGECVYFARSTARPGYVKIGQSQCVSLRRKSLNKKHPGRFHILACIETDQFERLEKALHERFRDGRDRRTEFFAERPVLEFITQSGGEK